MSMLVASEVIIPDDLDQEIPHSPGKRRLSQASHGSHKRPRLSGDLSSTQQVSEPSPGISTPASSDRLASGQLEERKRGKRLFGALIGTLAQSSSSAAHKRRTDIEKKQQEKLKQQTEELDDTKQQKLDELMKIRRMEQKKYDKQSTSQEPKLYYQPSQLLPGEEAKIKEQIEATEAMIEEELAEHRAKNENLPDDDPRPGTNPLADHETVDHGPDASTPLKPGDDPMDQVKTSPTESMSQENRPPTEPRRGSLDDNGEVILEGAEDTVIY